MSSEKVSQEPGEAEPLARVLCPRCGGENDPDDIFCQKVYRRWFFRKVYCTTPLHGMNGSCPRCSRPVPGKARCCGFCGVNLTEIEEFPGQ